MLRALVLSCIATFVGVAVCYTIPDALSEMLQRQLPIWFYERQVLMTHCIFLHVCLQPPVAGTTVRHHQPEYLHTHLCMQMLFMAIGTTVGNGIMTACFR